MPTAQEFAASQTYKIIYIGDSGTGKTGSKASLVAAGYNLRTLDLDNGVEVLVNYLLDKSSIYNRPQPGLWDGAKVSGLLTRFSFVTITEQMAFVGDKAVPKGTAWRALTRQLGNWTDGTRSFGNIDKWGSNDVLDIDGCSRLSDAALNYMMVLNGRAGQARQQQDYFQAQQLVEQLIQMLVSEQVKCHVIFNCHEAFLETESGIKKFYPQSVGSALSPKISQYFNHAIQTKQVGNKYVIRTKASATSPLKTTAPLRVKDEYSLETGLAEYFRDIRQSSQGSPSQGSPTPSQG